VLDEEQHLGIPVVRAERPTMVEDNGLAVAPVFVEDLDTVFGCDRSHCGIPFLRVLIALRGFGQGHCGYHAEAACQGFSARYRTLRPLIQIGHYEAVFLSHVLLTR
jgi:hypothetical protein